MVQSGLSGWKLERHSSGVFERLWEAREGMMGDVIKTTESGEESRDVLQKKGARFADRPRDSSSAAIYLEQENNLSDQSDCILNPPEFSQSPTDGSLRQ